jgi:hypothetical protein
LDAAYFHLYGLDREEVDYVLGQFQGVVKEDAATGGPGRTRRAILEAFDALRERQIRMSSGIRQSLHNGPHSHQVGTRMVLMVRRLVLPGSLFQVPGSAFAVPPRLRSG